MRPATCTGQPPYTATWHMENSVLAVRPDGSGAFAHAVSILRACNATAGVVYIPGYGHVVDVP